MSARAGVRARTRRLVHLVGRFFGSLRARPLDAATIARVGGVLEPAELRVWNGMARADRAEGVAVACRLDASLSSSPDAADTRWRAAALLHDAGKQRSGFGTVGRAAVTATAAVLGEARLRGWAAGPSGSTATVRARIGRYVAHDDLGATLLAEAGARPEVAAWAGAHHRPERWATTGIPPAVCRALAAADGEPVDDGAAPQKP